MHFAISGGADAESAMNGASVNALKPPMLLNAVLNSGPLYTYQGWIDVNTV